MAANNSINTQGATPFAQNVTPVSPGLTPQSKALGFMGNVQNNFNTAKNFLGGVSRATQGFFSPPTPSIKPVTLPDINSAVGNSTGLLAPTNQPVKSHTVTNVDGSTVSQTYHPPGYSASPQPSLGGETATTSQASQMGANKGLIAPPVAPTATGWTSSPAPVPQTNSNSLGSITGQLVNQQGSPYNTTAQSSIGSLGDTVARNQALEKNAQDIASQAGQQIADVGGQGARAEAGYKTTGTSPVGEGNAAITEQTTAAQQQAIAQGAQTALQGNAQALTGVGQEQSDLSSAGGLSLTGQNTAQGALTGAGQLSQPISQFGVLGTPTSVGPFGSNGGAAAFQGGYIGGQQAAGQTAAQMNVANTAAKGIQGTIQQYLQSNPQLNQSTSTIANAAQQWLQGKQLGDPSYQTLFNYLNEYISTLAPILGVGGDTTNLKTEIAQSFVNAKASGQSISQVLNNIGTLADQKLQNIVSAGQGGGQVAGGVPQGSNPTSFGTEW